MKVWSPQTTHHEFESFWNRAPNCALRSYKAATGAAKEDSQQTGYPGVKPKASPQTQRTA
jgi:hypothetical protein